MPVVYNSPKSSKSCRQQSGFRSRGKYLSKTIDMDRRVVSTMIEVNGKPLTKVTKDFFKNLIRLRNGPPIVFLHVMKCGGTSFARSLKNTLNSGYALKGYGDIFFEDGYNTSQLAVRERRQVHQGKLPRKKFDLVCGHFSLSSLEEAFPDGITMTVLREPRVRLLSQFLFGRAHTDEQIQRWSSVTKSSVEDVRGSLLSYLTLQSYARYNDNQFTRYLLEPHPLIPKKNFILPSDDERLLAAALEKLSSIAFVDILENPDLEKNASAFLKKEFKMVHTNETSKDGLKMFDLATEIAAALQHLETLNRIDLQLWNYAVRARSLDAKVFNSNRIFSSYSEMLAKKQGALAA